MQYMNEFLTIALVHLETGESVPILTEMDQANRDMDGYDDRHALIIRPLAYAGTTRRGGQS